MCLTRLFLAGWLGVFLGFPFVGPITEVLVRVTNPREDCMQEARNGGSPGGNGITDEEKAECDKLPDMEVTEA